MARQALDFVRMVWCGPSDEPTPEKPVVQSAMRTEKGEITTKRVLDVNYDERVKKLAEDSMRIKEETAAIVEKLCEEVAKDG